MATIIDHKKRIFTDRLKSISNYKNLDTDITPKPKDSDRQQAIKKVNILFTKINSPEYNAKETEQDNIKKKFLYGITESRIIAIQHDITTKAYNIPYIRTCPKIDYKKDTKEYLLINKQVRYKDITPKQILKILFTKHKITKWLYKDSVKRIQQGKPPKEKIRFMLNRYWQNLKAQSGKNTISNLSKQATESQRVRLKQMVNNTLYNVAIKRNPKAYSIELLGGETRQSYETTNKIITILPTQQPTNNIKQKTI